MPEFLFLSALYVFDFFVYKALTTIPWLDKWVEYYLSQILS